MENESSIDNIKKAYNYTLGENKFGCDFDIDLIDLNFEFEQRIKKMNILEEAKEILKKVEEYKGNKLRDLVNDTIKDLTEIINVCEETIKISEQNLYKKNDLLVCLKISYKRNLEKEYGQNEQSIKDEMRHAFILMSKDIIDEEVKFFISSEKLFLLYLDKVNQIKSIFNF